MERRNVHVPEGVQDYLPEECYYKRQAEQLVAELFEQWGYEEVQTPSFEYYDVFAGAAAGIGQVQQEQMHKFVDEQGRLLVLRPDLTLPIARVAATKLLDAPLPLRLCYRGNGFGYTMHTAGRQQEFAQIGIELMGEAGLKADAEVLMIGMRALQAAGVGFFQIEVGHMAFCKALFGSPLLQAANGKLRELVEQKNMPALRALLDTMALPERLHKALLALPSLFGSIEVLDEAEAITDMPECRAAIQQLRTLYDKISAVGLQHLVTFDLGMVQEMEYYSGITFRGMAPGLGYPLLSGGRYDGLLGTFGKPMPATGCAIGVRELLQVLAAQDALTGWQKPDYMVGWEAECDETAWKRIQDLQQRSVVCYLGDDRTGLIEEAKKRSVTHTLWISVQGEEVDVHV